MEFYRASLSNCGQAGGVVVVIDVLRAFTTAAYAFARGASQILLVSSVSEAFSLQHRYPGSLLMGEEKGLSIPGFDYGNSPYFISQAALSGKTLVQRTSAGTQGVVRSLKAERLLAASFVVAGATARFIEKLQPGQVTFVITGAESQSGGDEDLACADYIEALLTGGDHLNPEPYLQRVRESTHGKAFADPLELEFLVEDLHCSTQVDQFDFAMQVERRDGLLILFKTNPN